MAQRPPAIFVGDALALDFLNTVAAPVDAMVDFLDSGEALLAWMVQARLIDAGQAQDIRGTTGPEALDDIARQARELREWFRGFVASRKGRRLTVEDLAASERLNDILEADDTFNTLVAGDGSSDAPLQLQSVRRNRAADSLLFVIASSLAEFICDEPFIDVKECEGPGCGFFFADRTRGRARRWCSMAMCGNRAKQAAHRGRVKGIAGAS